MRSKEVEDAIKDLMPIEITDIYDNKISVGNKSIETVLAYIEELEKDIKDAMDGYNDLGKDLAFNFISKEDIRDKIKELEEKLKYIGGCDNNCKKCFNSERENSFKYCFAYHQIKVLKSIIGE